MTTRRQPTVISADGRLPVERGDAVVCLHAAHGGDALGRAVASLVAHTAPEIPLLVFTRGSKSDVEALAGSLESANPDLRLFVLGLPAEMTAVAQFDAVLGCSAPGDPVLVSDDCEVEAGWLDGLRAAAASSGTVATASALAEGPASLQRSAGAAPADAGAPPPRIYAPTGPCVYIRRSAVELVALHSANGADGGLLPALGDRSAQLGLCHVLAEGVLVGHAGAVVGAPEAGSFPFNGTVEGAVEAEYSIRGRPVARARSGARRSADGPSVTIDARCLTASTTGTQVQTLALVAALARYGGRELRVVVQRELSDQARTTLGRLGGIELLTEGEIPAGISRSDVVHRPYQVTGVADYMLLATLGERLIVTQLDLLLYWNRSYFRSAKLWEDFRRYTRATLLSADRVVVPSDHVGRELLAENLVEPGRLVHIPLGVDHHDLFDAAEPRSPERAGQLVERDFLLCMGMSYRHKNRRFALAVLEELRQRHDWKGMLVFAGGRAEASSADDLAGQLRASPDTAAATLDLGPVDEREKAWLFQHARLLLYPTTHEGFGLMPFEAAAQGLPSLFAPTPALDELLPQELAGIEPWDVASAADRAHELLSDPSARESLVSDIDAAGKRYRWRDVAERTMRLYEEVALGPTAATASLGWDYASVASELEEAEREAAARSVSDDALRLVGPGGYVPPALERPLLALAARPRLRQPVFAALKAAYGLGHIVGRWRR